MAKKTTSIYTDEFKLELDRRYAAYKDGSEKAITSAESKSRIEELLFAARTKQITHKNCE